MISNNHKPARPSAGTSAFTLIELLVVIGIIAVLVAITIPVISKMQQASRSTATTAQLATLANGIQQYYNDFHAYPGPLPNTQVGVQLYGTGVTPFVPHPTIPNTFLNLTTPGGNPFTNNTHITGAENLVLGLLGGLELLYNSASNQAEFNYNPSIIFPNVGTNDWTPNPNGATSLNANKPHRWTSYIQVKSSEISHPQVTPSNANGSFVDAAGRMANDTIIPEFIDQWPEGLPILYFRANHGGTAVVGIGGKDDSGNPLTDNVVSPPVTVTPQYDLAGTVEYTKTNPASPVPGPIGTQGKLDINDHHGLQGLGNPNFGSGSTADTIKSQWLSTTPAPGGNGSNACIYFKDPSVVYDPATNPNLSNTHGATARQKDGYLLVSPGPDRVYGTADDIIYPGSLNP